MSYGVTTTYQPGLFGRIGDALLRARDWLDQRGKPAWLVAMIAGFIFVWPVGLAILIYMIGSNRMFSCANRRQMLPRGFTRSTGNSAFDAYREETLKRLEDEHQEFTAFMARLREARDKAEFDQFVTERRAAANRPNSA